MKTIWPRNHHQKPVDKVLLYMNMYNAQTHTHTHTHTQMLHRKKEKNTICSSINWPNNLVSNVFAYVHYFLAQSQGNILSQKA